MLRYTDEDGVFHDKVDTAVRRLQAFEPAGGRII